MGFKYIPLSGEDKKIFCGDALRTKYWEQFCDGFYSYIADPDIYKQDKPYESSYEYYRLQLFGKGIENNTDEWYKKILEINKGSLERFKATYILFKSLKREKDAVLPMFLALCNMQQFIVMGLMRDKKLLEFMHPRKTDFKYKDYTIDYKYEYPEDFTEFRAINENEKEVLAILLKKKSYDPDWKKIIKKYEDGDYTFLNDIISDILRIIIEDYNEALSDFDCGVTYIFENESPPINAFIANLFLTYTHSRLELKQILDENPPFKYFSIFQELRDSEIKSFKESVLGKHWCDCIKDDEVESFSRYLINHRKTISEEEELRFFRQFDKICMLEDILGGNADKYDLEVDYSIIDNGDSCTADAEEKKQEIEDETESVNENENSDAVDENNPLDRIFHEAINMQIMKEAISDIIKHKKEVDKRELSIWQWYVVYRVLKEIDWLTDDTQTKFIQWVKDEFGWSWNTINFKSINADLKKIRTRDWGKYTVKDNNTGQKYSELADYVRNTFVKIKNDKIYDREKFLRKGSDNTPMFIYHIENE